MFTSFSKVLKMYSLHLDPQRENEIMNFQTSPCHTAGGKMVKYNHTASVRLLYLYEWYLVIS